MYDITHAHTHTHTNTHTHTHTHTQVSCDKNAAAIALQWRRERRRRLPSGRHWHEAPYRSPRFGQHTLQLLYFCPRTTIYLFLFPPQDAVRLHVSVLEPLPTCFS
jgi:hypothetical protein